MNKEASEAALIAAAQAASGTNSALFALGGGLMAIATVAYMWIRRIKSDARDDPTLRFVLDENVKVVTFYRESLEKKTEEYEIACKERNEAVQQIGKFTATIGHLQETIERQDANIENQTSMIEQLKKENKDLRETLENQGDMLRSVLEQLARVSEKFDLKPATVKKLEVVA